ncbi:MAG: dTDP-4-dehydrorhamnose reductase [Chloroflexota bacterium]
MTLATPVAVTGANGRLGRALIEALKARGEKPISWARPDYDLDSTDCSALLMARDRPRTVIHAAAWTDVDGCAREPEVAARRNAVAVRELAEACAAAGSVMVLVSTNEVFDGARTDGQGYGEDDPVGPINAYGASKLFGEALAGAAFEQAGREEGLLTVRTAWLFGAPGNDFPTKILAAADRLSPGAALRVVADEVGSPTHAPELARALLDLVAAAPAGTYHLAATGHASRHEVARAVLERCRPGTRLEPITRAEYSRASQPPAWSVLDCSKAASHGVTMRRWQDGLSHYLAELC